jgi:hypothetical protein
MQGFMAEFIGGSSGAKTLQSEKILKIFKKCISNLKFVDTLLGADCDRHEESVNFIYLT